jgi:hypothetical protein
MHEVTREDMHGDMGSYIRMEPPSTIPLRIYGHKARLADPIYTSRR